MKKTLSIILMAVMVLEMLAVVPMTAFATEPSATPAGTAIGSEADFLAMEADGTYYLDADITINETYAQTFKGTFDGNGKTVTVAAPMFGTVENATIKNFNVMGEILIVETTEWTNGTSNDFVAAVAVLANGTTSFADIVSNADITCTTTNTRAAAIAAYSAVNSVISITDCVNNGDITVKKYAGGVYGWTDKAIEITLTDCINDGNVTSSAGYVGGISCRVSNKNNGKATFKDCKNYGEVKGKDQIGGIIGYSAGTITMIGCYNGGFLSDTDIAAAASGGMIGRTDDGNDTLTLTNCINDGNIVADNQSGGMIGYSRTEHVIATNCINNGDIESANYGGGLIGRVGDNDDLATDASATFTACLNTGNLISLNATTSYAAGMVGYLCGGVSANYCINTGNMTAGTNGGNGFAGGIIAASQGKTATVSISIKNCINYGTIKGNVDVGGIASRTGTTAPLTSYIFENCINYGDVINTAKSNHASTLRTGGIVGYSWGDGVSCIKNCVNYGNITVDASGCTTDASVLTGGIIGYVNGNKYVVTNCANLGNIAVTGENDMTVGTVYNKTAPYDNSFKDLMAKNYSIAIGTYQVAEYGNWTETTTATGAVTTLDEAQNGTLVATLNINADSAIFEVRESKIALVCEHDYAIANGKCPACGTVYSAVGGYTVTMGDNIGVNFYMELTPEILADDTAYMTFTLPNSSTEKVYVKDVKDNTESIGGKTYYKFSGHIAVKEMAKDVKGQITALGGTTDTYTCSVKKYAMIVINGASYTENEKALAKALLNYGAYAQNMFAYDVESLANSELEAGDKDVSAVTVSDSYKKNVTAAIDGVNYLGTSTMWESDTAIRHYFDITGESVTFKLYAADDTFIKDLAVETNDNGKYVVIDGIVAKDMATTYKVVVSNGTSEQTISYSVYSYFYDILNDSKYSDAEKTAIKAAYAYSQAAITYLATR